MEYDDVDEFERRLFRSVAVRELRDEDFYLNTAEGITLKAAGCSFVLFYIVNDEISLGVRDIYYNLSERFADVNFFAVNASERSNIMQAFGRVRNDRDHPLSRFLIRGYPTLLVYREAAGPGLSWPQAFYNGLWSENALTDWMLTLACEPGYQETPSLREGVVSETDVVVTDPRGLITTRPLSSLDYATGDLDGLEDGIIDDRLDLEEDILDQVDADRLYDPNVLADLEDDRKYSEQTLRSFRTTDPVDSPVDPQLLEQFSDRELGIIDF